MPGPSGISTKTIGLIAAAILTIVFILIIVITLTSNTQAPNPNANLFPPDQSEIPNIEDTQTGGAMLVTMVDKNDPTRVAGTLKAERFEPIGEGRRRLDKPESWIYLKDGRAVKVTADFATMLMPDPNEPPESGTLEGNIMIRVFASIPTPGTPPPVEMDPSLTARFEEPVEFERRYLRLRSPGHFDITSDQFDFAGTDLTVILNELRDRVELIDVLEGDELVIHIDAANKPIPQTKSTSNAQQSTPTSTTVANSTTDQRTNSTKLVDTPANLVAGTTPANAAASPIDILNRYHITLNDSVLASVSGSGSASADRLELWAALEGSTLPADAIRPIAFLKSTDEDNTPQSSSAPSSTARPATRRDDTPIKPASTTQANDITITWSGKMTVRPIDDDIPPELLNDALSLKLGSDEGKGIHFEIPDRHFTGQAFAATYHATRGVLELSSKPIEESIIRLASADAGSLLATALLADLGTGTIELPGRGQITSTPRGENDPDTQATIQWKNTASFTLSKSNDALTDRLTRASFDGTVIAKQAGNSLGARTLDARFDPTRPSSIALEQLVMSDGVLSSAARSMLSGKALTIGFAPAPSGTAVAPTRLEAAGQVFARNTESMLKADHLVTTMTHDLAGDLVLETADAEGQINYTGVDRTSARADTLTADAINETMTLLGKDATVAQGGSSIVGDHINLNARRRSIEVLGPGSFDHDITLEDAPPDAQAKGHIRATWKGSMRFDDAIGSIICEKQVRVVSTPDAYTRDTLTANRAEIKLTPMPTDDPIAGNTGQSNTNNERELLSARIFGHAPQGKPPVPATIESRTYAQDDPERVIGLIYLEGTQIIADNRDQTLNVPSPGTLLILDRSEKEHDANTETALSTTGPGLTRFTWVGHMNLDRAGGAANFTDTVVVRQKTLSTGQIVQLETDNLDAEFEIGQQDQDQSTRLISAHASGSVRFLFEQRELLADSAIYNAIEDSLFASAIDNKLVTVYDEAKPAPFSAKTMRWDLTNDRIEIDAPTPTRTTTGG
jgi:lipopolysaccharide export system protein LptA